VCISWRNKEFKKYSSRDYCLLQYGGNVTGQVPVIKTLKVSELIAETQNLKKLKK
jgi:hypothetical protein